MPKWLVITISSTIGAIVLMHFVTPGTIPDWLAILISSTLIIVQFVYPQIQRQKALQEIRDELHNLRQELKELKETQQH